MRIIFFGTPKFAENVLQKLIEQAYFDFVGVVCAEDKPVGRKKIITPPAVKVLAEKNKIQVLQPKKLDQDFVPEIKELDVDLIITCAYGKIIPKAVLDVPKYGALNVHPSLLPKYRGASPIQTALLKGDKESGVSIIQMDEEMDHGPIVSMCKIEISDTDNYTTLAQKLADISAEMLIKVLPDYVAGKIKIEEQAHEKASFCKIIKKEDGEIDWHKSAQEIYNQWRAFIEWPGVFTKNIEILKNSTTQSIKLVEIKKASVENVDLADKQLGDFFTQNKKLFVKCGDNSVLEILKIQPQGKNVMDAQSFVNGYLK